MPDEPYTIADLARLADVTPRTIRYYVAQGLLPSPGAAGPATRYGEGHLARLRLIRRLQREHRPLAEIRVRLERMGDGDVEAALVASEQALPEPPRGTDATLVYVRDLMTRAGVAPRFYGQPSATPAPLANRMEFQPGAPDMFPVRETPGPLPSVPAPSSPAETPATLAPLVPAPREVIADRSTWERLSITPDVEIHVRRPLDRAANKRVERLVRIAHELFDEES
jgi:DNA-binding transcriptional MerR regulator